MKSPVHSADQTLLQFGLPAKTLWLPLSGFVAAGRVPIKSRAHAADYCLQNRSFHDMRSVNMLRRRQNFPFRSTNVLNILKYNFFMTLKHFDTWFRTYSTRL